VDKSQKEVEEYYRRMLVKLVREAGTKIRIEMIKRQALTAEINLNYANSLRKLIQEDYELLSKPLENILRESFEKFKKGEDIGRIIEDLLISSLTTSMQAFFIRPLPEMVKHIENVNNFLESVINKIIDELSKEGIYLHAIEPVCLPTQDIVSVARSLKDALSKIDMAIGILKGLIELSKQSNDVIHS
jgi:hypothetical protein